MRKKSTISSFRCLVINSHHFPASNQAIGINIWKEKHVYCVNGGHSPSIFAWNSRNEAPKKSSWTMRGSKTNDGAFRGFSVTSSDLTWLGNGVGGVARYRCGTPWRMSQLHRFFTLMVERPGNASAIVVHLFPWTAWLVRRSRSSSVVHTDLITSGESWPSHRSRHCLLVRPGTIEAMRIQEFVPCLLTARTRLSSSSADHFTLCGVEEPSPQGPPAIGNIRGKWSSRFRRTMSSQFVIGSLNWSRSCDTLFSWNNREDSELHQENVMIFVETYAKCQRVVLLFEWTGYIWFHEEFCYFNWTGSIEGVGDCLWRSSNESSIPFVFGFVLKKLRGEIL
jgi:hypothetical protein